MKTASARLSVEVLLNCPHCGQLIDIMDPSETCGHNHNDEGFILDQAFPEDQGFDVEEVCCFNCKNEFNVKGLTWD